MLEHLPDPSTKGSTKGRAAAEGRLRLWMGLASVQASSGKQQASITHQAASIKQQAPRNRALKLWQETKKSLNKLFCPIDKPFGNLLESQLGATNEKLKSPTEICEIRKYCHGCIAKPIRTIIPILVAKLKTCKKLSKRSPRQL